jgi:hypothetical protein
MEQSSTKTFYEAELSSVKIKSDECCRFEFQRNPDRQAIKIEGDGMFSL